ncbi:conserved hypothetical protein [Neisseria gonorrhoeae DGI2]|uniref:Uncharacterized protein n=4 Tax=Neisseria TaxID=482 RepID=A0A0H5QB99_NEIMI|nr:Hypothetical protein NGK_2089 [Neisseria gonorrhoeae NCCP11945]AHW76738.1 hypothetical protein NMA510612_2477 [Neisseria meningitidis]EFE05051.1 conserved hypothetical protein [Neisseria gonorrhoeae DGI2]EFV63273.1 hypothetical protein NMH_1868 [Neisseria meningitidis H44/76]CRY99264.1 hypothetical protein [Neisseria meningitidis serogroup B]
MVCHLASFLMGFYTRLRLHRLPCTNKCNILLQSYFISK